MRKILCLLLGTSLVLFFSAAAPAQVGIDIHGLYGFNFSDDDAELDNTFGGGGSLVICLGPNVKLDLGADYMKPEIKDASSNYVVLIPVTATLRVGWNAGPVFLYVGGGGGYSFNDLDWQGGSGGFDLEDSFTYHACGGAEVSISRNIAVRGEFRYVWNTPELKAPSSLGGGKADWKMDHMQGRAGLAFYF